MPETTEIGKTLFTQEKILGRVTELGEQISADYINKDLAIVAILRGSFIFAADLIRSLSVNASMDFMSISRYGGQTTPGLVRITKDLDESINGRDVLLVEDIIDTGLTAAYLLRILRQREPVSLEICTLLDKSARRIIDLHIAYRGFEVPDVFVIGYGLDYQQRHRNLPYIAELQTGGGNSKSNV